MSERNLSFLRSGAAKKGDVHISLDRREHESTIKIPGAATVGRRLLKQPHTEEMEQVAVQLEAVLVRRLRAACVAERRTLRSVITELVEAWLADHSNS